MTLSSHRPLFSLFALGLAALLAFAFALKSGSTPMAWAELWRALFGGADPLQAQILWQLRLPRAASAFVVGGALAVSGALLQVLLRNPLADPYILGVSGGAASGALALLLLGLSASLVPMAAFVGALASLWLVFGLSRGGGQRTPLRLLLTGVVVAAGWSALITLLLSLSPDTQLRGMLFWLMGDLGQSGGPGLLGLLLLAVLATGLAFARDLNLLAGGELRAASLGVSVLRLQNLVYLLASLLTAAAVSLAGSIGFVGLVVPHLLRLWMGSDHRALLPACVLGGGTLLLLADTLARSLLAPRELPVGVLTAFLGVPLFLYLLQRQAKTGGLR